MADCSTPLASCEMQGATFSSENVRTSLCGECVDVADRPSMADCSTPLASCEMQGATFSDENVRTSLCGEHVDVADRPSVADDVADWSSIALAMSE